MNPEYMAENMGHERDGEQQDPWEDFAGSEDYLHERDMGSELTPSDPTEMPCGDVRCRGNIPAFVRGMLGVVMENPDLPKRKVVALGPIVNPADPTQTYVLECGHLGI